MTALLALPLLIPVITAALLLLLRNSGRRLLATVNILSTVLLLASSIVLLSQVSTHGILVLEVGGWKAPAGIVLVADLLSASMLVITALIGFCVSIHSVFEVASEKSRTGYLTCFQTLLLGVCGSFLTGDLFNLFVWFEVMLISSFVMMSFDGSRDEIEGTFKYTALNYLASLLFLAGAGLIYGAYGTLNLADLGVRMAGPGAGPLVKEICVVFLLCAFGAKAGVFPLYNWLPSSYHTTSTTSAALFAGLLTKVGVYALIRTLTLVDPTALSWAGPLLIVVSCLTMIFGVLGAASQYNTKRILSFHIISQIGYMTLGLAISTTAAIAAAVFYVLHHIIVKTNLFLISGLIHQLKGTSELRKIGGLLREAPVLGIVFLVPALSLAGLPPLSGFFAKFVLLKSVFLAEHYLAGAIALVVGFLTLFSMTKIWIEAFWKPQPNEPVLTGQRLHPAQYLPIFVMAGLTLCIGLWPEPLLNFGERVAEQILDPSFYRDAVLKRGSP